MKKQKLKKIGKIAVGTAAAAGLGYLGYRYGPSVLQKIKAIRSRPKDVASAMKQHGKTLPLNPGKFKRPKIVRPIKKYNRLRQIAKYAGYGAIGSLGYFGLFGPPTFPGPMSMLYKGYKDELDKDPTITKRRAALRAIKPYKPVSVDEFRTGSLGKRYDV